jgi:hypothetical protein
MKKYISILFLFSIIISCKKDNDANSSDTPLEYYSSTSDFIEQNAVQKQHFVINATTGGTYTALQGTEITIPANCFKSLNNELISGNVDIYFQEVYKKSDMIFGSVNTGNSLSQEILISGGMFSFEAKKNENDVIIDDSVKVVLPFSSSPEPADSGMMPFVYVFDPLVSSSNFWYNVQDTLNLIPDVKLGLNAISYVMELFNSMSFGTWVNCDNGEYFNNFNRVPVNLHLTQPVDSFGTMVSLVFRDQNSVVSLYSNSVDPDEFSYQFAPEGVSCTAVAFGVKNGKLYSSFTPFQISNNYSVNISMEQTTRNEFKYKLEQLN